MTSTPLSRAECRGHAGEAPDDQSVNLAVAMQQATVDR